MKSKNTNHKIIVTDHELWIIEWLELFVHHPMFFSIFQSFNISSNIIVFYFAMHSQEVDELEKKELFKKGLKNSLTQVRFNNHMIRSIL